jgi:purine-nucleoside phosphorylase
MHIQTLVVSVVSNKCYPLDEIKETSIADVIRVVEKSAPGLQLVIKKLLEELYA